MTYNLQGVSLRAVKATPRKIEFTLSGYPQCIDRLLACLKLWLLEKDGVYKVAVSFNLGRTIATVVISKPKEKNNSLN